MIDRFHRLRHDTVIGCHHENNDIGHLGAASSHCRKSLMTRRIDESHLLPARRIDLIRANMLGDTTGLAGNHVALTQSIEQ